MCNTATLDRRSVVRMIAAVPAASLLAACGPNDNPANQPPVAIEKGDTCAVCGMFITPYPGPRGEAYVAGVAKPLKLGGGLRDFFAYVTQPDVVYRLGTLYVQDTAHIDWAHPSDAAASFTDARKAYYVAWQPLPGEMGPAFASFAKHGDAEAFIRAHGGALLQFNQVTPDLVSSLTYTCPSAASPSYQLATKTDCVTKAVAAPAYPKGVGTEDMAPMPGMQDHIPGGSE